MIMQQQEFSERYIDRMDDEFAEERDAWLRKERELVRELGMAKDSLQERVSRHRALKREYERADRKLEDEKKEREVAVERAKRLSDELRTTSRHRNVADDRSTRLYGDLETTRAQIRELKAEGVRAPEAQSVVDVVDRDYPNDEAAEEIAGEGKKPVDT